MEKYTNALINETSPYLLQHAHNPVDWYPWGEEAFARARAEDKPILLSVGYATCHWCHVMERESFMDEATAALLNANFVCIKVDREERPDLDEIYMAAVQAMTGNGGWPMSVWLTPDLEPFYGGTYFPKEQWIHVLKSLVYTYNNVRAKTLEYAQQLTEGIRGADLIEKAQENLSFEAEKLWGDSYSRGTYGSSRADS